MITAIRQIDRLDWFNRASVVYLLLVVPLYLQCAGWQAGFGSQGWYTLICSTLQSPPVLEGWKGAIWVHSMAAIPWVVAIVSASLIFVDAELEESADQPISLSSSLPHLFQIRENKGECKRLLYVPKPKIDENKGMGGGKSVEGARKQRKMR